MVYKASSLVARKEASENLECFMRSRPSSNGMSNLPKTVGVGRMKDLKEFKITVPMWDADERDKKVYIPLKEWMFWKVQCERVNTLIDSAIDTRKSNSHGWNPGFFIPMPEEPDSAEKLIEDLASFNDWKSDVGVEFQERARALMAKEK